MTSVPIIDVSGLRGDRAARQAVADQIGRACEEIGFFCITGHGIPQELIRRVREASLAFFDRDEEEKRAIERQPPSYRGYIPLASEGLARSLGRAGAAADLKEAFSMGPVGAPDDAYHRSAEAAPHFAPNRWPASPADFQPAFEAYYEQLAALAGTLLGGFALALGLPEDWFADKVDRHISNVRALHYPAQPEEIEPGQIRAGEHTDYGCLTILLTEANKGGLEVLNRRGEWEAVPHLPDSFVVNIGDLMAQWSNDRYVSTMHRVANPPRSGNTRRLSIAFFHQPNHDALIECIPGCAGPGNPARYEPITSGGHRLMKVSRANQAATTMA
ncbi:isopenicillin N synthase family dioxygenase [Roseomonas populi]|uniref:2-oxoglutarate-dependent ethylene/succinate-forming enzyme n=1 Tax=Roseomonas populi TaxID=3121582 RepID=A0ABT1XC36_9PROT|nr:2-oxoglutarate and iron-dependent oxygenase domain-containing protein [Roseomonas pecuniae]MCR0985688.1 isopenicillin N synthase family oxygenase [Roseomonas pecuniae]